MTRKKKRNQITAILTAFFIIGGCAYLSSGFRNEDFLRKRVSKEWQAKMDNNWGIVYDLTTAKSREKFKRDQFLQKSGFDVKGFTIEKLNLDPDKKQATVTVRFDIQYMGTPFKGMRVRENWVWEDYEWRLDLSTKPISPFEKKKTIPP